MRGMQEKIEFPYSFHMWDQAVLWVSISALPGGRLGIVYGIGVKWNMFDVIKKPYSCVLCSIPSFNTIFTHGAVMDLTLFTLRSGAGHSTKRRSLFTSTRRRCGECSCMTVLLHLLLFSHIAAIVASLPLPPMEGTSPNSAPSTRSYPGDKQPEKLPSTSLHSHTRHFILVIVICSAPFVHN